MLYATYDNDEIQTIQLETCPIVSFDEINIPIFAGQFRTRTAN